MKKTTLVLACSVLALASVAPAAVVEYTSRTAWETAAGGAPTLTDNYNDIASDVTVGSNVIGRDGYSLTGAMWLDAAPFLYIGGDMTIDGTSDVLKVDALLLTFANPTMTFGADWMVGGGSQNWTLNYTTNGGDSGSFQMPWDSHSAEFNGIIATNEFTTVQFSAVSFWGAMDNLAAHPIPEPATMSLLALGGMAILRRRKK